MAKCFKEEISAFLSFNASKTISVKTDSSSSSFKVIGIRSILIEFPPKELASIPNDFKRAICSTSKLTKELYGKSITIGNSGSTVSWIWLNSRSYFHS